MGVTSLALATGAINPKQRLGDMAGTQGFPSLDLHTNIIFYQCHPEM